MRGNRTWTTLTLLAKNNTYKRMVMCHLCIEKNSARGISSFIVASRWYVQVLGVRKVVVSQRMKQRMESRLGKLDFIELFIKLKLHQLPWNTRRRL